MRAEDEEQRAAGEPQRIPCRSLRTKLYAIDAGAGRPWLTENVPTEHYWCLWTHGPVGPDDRPADPDGCRERRGCFRPMAPAARDRQA